MNTAQLSQRLGSLLKVDDPTLLPGAAALDVLSAMNAGLQTFYREMPSIYKRTTLSHILLAPIVVLSLTATAQYSTLLSGTPFTALQFGCSVQIDGITPRNEVTGVSSLLDGWLIPTLTANATVYSDAAAIDAVIENITSEVRISSEGHGTTVLVRDDTLRHRRHHISLCGAPGRPRWYCIDGNAASQSGTPAFVIRVAPYPSVDTIIRFEAELGPQTLTFSNLVTPIAVPVPPHRAEDLLLPLCEAELTRSRFWRDPALKKGILDRAQEVLMRRIGQTPADIGAPRNLCGTPRGF